MTYEEMYGLFYFLPVNNVGKVVFSGEHAKVRSLSEGISRIGTYGRKQEPGYRQCAIVVCDKRQMYIVWYDKTVSVHPRTYKQIVEMFRCDGFVTSRGETVRRRIRVLKGSIKVPGAAREKLDRSQLMKMEFCILYKNEEGDFTVWEPGKFRYFPQEEENIRFTQSNDRNYPHYDEIMRLCTQLQHYEDYPAKVRFLPDGRGGYRFEIWDCVVMVSMRHMFDLYTPLLTGPAEEFDAGACLRCAELIRNNSCYWVDRPFYVSYDPCEWEQDSWLQWEPMKEDSTVFHLQ